MRDWPLPVVRLSDELNPFHMDGVELRAVLADHLPDDNAKFITVLGLLQGALEKGLFSKTPRRLKLVEATSGNTGRSLALLASKSPFLVEHVKLIVAPDLPDGKRYPLILAGAECVPPEEGLSAIATARKLGGGGWTEDGWHVENGFVNLDQYACPAGFRLHEEWTAPKILNECRSFQTPPTVLVAGIGTGGMIRGISRGLQYLLSEKLSVIGVLCAPGQEIPGVRSREKMKEISIPWQSAADEVMEIETRVSYLSSLWFHWQMGITPGPSSGFAYAGALKFLKLHKQAGDLDRYRGNDGMVRVIIFFPDGSRPYGDRFMANLPAEYISPLTAPKPWSLL